MDREILRRVAGTDQFEIRNHVRDFIETNCPFLNNIYSIYRPEKATASGVQPEIIRILRFIVENKVDVDFVKGLPGSGKTTIADEEEKLLKFLGFKVNRVQYDDVLRAVAPLLGENTDEYRDDAWLFVSYLLINLVFNPFAIRLADKDNIKDHWQLVKSFCMRPNGFKHILDIMIQRAIEYEPFPSHVTLLEAPAVANVRGSHNGTVKDRGVIAETILAAREKYLQSKGLRPRTITKYLVPDPRTMELAIKVRNIATHIHEVLCRGPRESLTLSSFESHLAELQQLQVSPFQSTDYISDLEKWTSRQLGAAPESFIKSMYEEELMRARDWLARTGPVGRAILEEVKLPLPLVRALGKDKMREIKLLAACYSDSLRLGYRSDQVFLLVNQFSPKSLSYAEDHH